MAVLDERQPMRNSDLTPSTRCCMSRWERLGLSMVRVNCRDFRSGLTAQFGQGVDVSNLRHMWCFYLALEVDLGERLRFGNKEG